MLCFFFNDTATTEIYTLSLHDALPIFWGVAKTLIPAPLRSMTAVDRPTCATVPRRKLIKAWLLRSEEHTSELQSRQYLVCRLLLEKNKISFFILSFDSVFSYYTCLNC